MNESQYRNDQPNIYYHKQTGDDPEQVGPDRGSWNPVHNAVLGLDPDLDRGNC